MNLQPFVVCDEGPAKQQPGQDSHSLHLISTASRNTALSILTLPLRFLLVMYYGSQLFFHCKSYIIHPFDFCLSDKYKFVYPYCLKQKLFEDIHDFFLLLKKVFTLNFYF